MKNKILGKFIVFKREIIYNWFQPTHEIFESIKLYFMQFPY